MKMLDPGSTVREGEFANAQNAASARNAVSAPRAKAVAMADLKPVVKTVVKLAPTHALKPVPMRRQS